MKLIKIDNEYYSVEDYEFNEISHPEFNNLKLYEQLGDLERVIELVRDIRQTMYNNICEITMTEATADSFGGFLENKLNYNFEESKYEIYLALDNLENTYENLQHEIIICPNQIPIYKSFLWKLDKNELYLNIKPKIYDVFYKHYHWYFSKENNQFNYNNMIHLVIMVKNAGEGFREILEKNIPHIDMWTILDTGSTDNTLEIIKEVLVPKVRGNLYMEPFIDFGTSRNRALELAGDISKYTIMLDDTYYLSGDLRGFLTEVRSDQFSDSFSLYINSDDVQYVSNRILKTQRKLKYIYKIHEVIQPNNNVNVIVPIDRACIIDKQSDYMQDRTKNRKKMDLDLLFSSIKEDPNVSRHYYYVAQTYVGMENWEMAYKYFLERIYHHDEGFLQEKIDACFEAARLANFRLNKPWSEVEHLYNKAYEMDKTRPDSVYFLGIQQYLHGDKEVAYQYFKKAFEIGYPLHAQYSLKPTLTYHYNPKFLTELCYTYGDFLTGEKAAKLFMENNPFDQTISSWYGIYKQLNKLPARGKIIRPKQPYLCFVADGNWNSWTGSDINKKGLGGSETYIVEMARWIQLSGHFQVFVFCNCSKEENFEGVEYVSLNKYHEFIQTYIVQICIISRYTEYIPATYHSNVENIYLVMHDLTIPGSVIINEPKLKNIFLLTNWHKNEFSEKFETLKDKTDFIHYGVNSKFIQPDSNHYPTGYNFIYSSFANRGLRVLLQMWKQIRNVTNNKAKLSIYCNVDHDWVVKTFPEEVKSIKQLMSELMTDQEDNGITYHGWVDKETLANGWKEADIWLYPCIFNETFCLTALEAAASRTLVLCNDLGALVDTVGNRGIMIQGSAENEVWQQTMISIIKNIYEQNNSKLIKNLVDENYKWAINHSWENQANILLKKILPNNLEYRNMFNWTNDIPKGSLKTFKDIINFHLKDIIHPRILEIGTWSGTSIIGLLNLLPTGSAVTIDPWDNYYDYKNNETNLDLMGSFSKNIKLAGLEDRVVSYKNSSHKKLLDLIEDREYFHLIYVDGSHKLLDSYLDIVLAWRLLSKNGILIMDDYEFGNKNDLENPTKGIDHFLEIFKDELVVLEKDIRVFVKKTSL